MLYPLLVQKYILPTMFLSRRIMLLAAAPPNEFKYPIEQTKSTRLSLKSWRREFVLDKKDNRYIRRCNSWIGHVAVVAITGNDKLALCNTIITPYDRTGMANSITLYKTTATKIDINRWNLTYEMDNSNEWNCWQRIYQRLLGIPQYIRQIIFTVRFQCVCVFVITYSVYHCQKITLDTETCLGYDI